MKKTLYLAVFTVFFTLSSISGAVAGSLSKAQAEGFVSSMSDVGAMAKEMEKEGKTKIFDAQNKPVPGEKFKPYSGSLPVLKKEYPADYEKLGDIVRKHGFKSQESWATTGDDVMLAYMAGKMKGMPTEMPQIPAGMEDKLPPEALANMKRGMAMLETMRDVPAEHTKIVEPLSPQIDAWIAAQSE